MAAYEMLVYGIVIHLACDWLFQNHWMAINKTNTRHLAGYVHGAIHALGMALIFPIPAAIVIGVSHWLIDLRFIMGWWSRVYRQTSEGEFALTIAVWRDQTIHIVIIALVAIAIGYKQWP